MILYFNPGHETAVHNASPFYMPPANVAAMQKELALLPAWYGNKEDVVLIDNLSTGYYDTWIEKLPLLPKIITKDDISQYKGTEASLWGISPQSIHFFEELEKEYEIELIVPKWHERYKYLNSREAARDVLSALIDEIPGISGSIIPHFYNDLEEIEKLADSSYDRLLAKAPYSSSGRGLLWLPVSGLTRTERQILHGILKKQGSVSIEKALDKQTDFAMEFICDGSGDIRFEGYSLFYTNAKGAYESNYIGAQSDIEKQLADKIPLLLLDKVKSALANILKDKYAGIYKGCLGVDMMIYKDKNEYKLHPCVEVNMRYNMGYLAVRLFDSYIYPSSEGRFHIDFDAKEGEVYRKHQNMQDKYPVTFADGRLQSGYMPLCPVTKQSRYWTYVVVS